MTPIDPVFDFPDRESPMGTTADGARYLRLSGRPAFIAWAAAHHLTLIGSRGRGRHHLLFVWAELFRILRTRYVGLSAVRKSHAA